MQIIHKKRWIWGVVLIVLLVVVGGFSVYNKINLNQKLMQFSELSARARVAINDGDFNDAVTFSEQALAVAPDVQHNIAGKVLLAEALLSRGASDDISSAVQTYQSVLADPATNVATKARVYNDIGSIYFFSPINSYAASSSIQSLVFGSLPFSKYLSQADGNVRKATQTIFENSIALYPTSYANYELANLIAYPLVQTGVGTKSVQLSVAAQARNYIAAGDAIVAQSSVSFSPAEIIRRYSPRSYALSVIGDYFPDISTTTIDASFDQVMIAYNDIDPGGKSPQAQELYFRLIYAARLNSAEHGKQDAKIKDLLAAFQGQANTFSGFDSFILGIQRSPAAYPRLIKQFPELQNISPAFTDYLQLIGWKKS